MTNEGSPAKIVLFIPLAKFENVKEAFFLRILFYSTASDSCFSFPCRLFLVAVTLKFIMFFNFSFIGMLASPSIYSWSELLPQL